MKKNLLLGALALIAGSLLAADSSPKDDVKKAAAALGMGRNLALRRIILPQAMRVIIPPTGNETISMLKTTSLAATIAVLELTGSAQLIYGSNNLQIPLLVVASLWYLLMTSVLTIGQYFIEKRFSRGTRIIAQRPGARLIARFLAARRDETGSGASVV